MKKFLQGTARVCRHLLRPFFPIKIMGQRKFEKKRRILVGNHLSGWDSVMFFTWTRSQSSYMYKAEFENKKFLNFLLKNLECIPVHRGQIDPRATKMAMELLNKERTLALFPEGTRNPYPGTLLPFHTGVAYYAIKTHAPIQPFFIWDKTKAFCKNYILVGEEFTLEEFYDKPLTKENLNAATEIIYEKMKALGARLDEIMAEKGKKRRKPSKKDLAKRAEFDAKVEEMRNMTK